MDKLKPHFFFIYIAKVDNIPTAAHYFFHLDASAACRASKGVELGLVPVRSKQLPINTYLKKIVFVA